MAKIDSVRRECEDLGTSLPKDAKEARAALGAIHKRAMSPEYREPEADLSPLVKELEAFRVKFKIDEAVASSYHK